MILMSLDPDKKRWWIMKDTAFNLPRQCHRAIVVRCAVAILIATNLTPTIGCSDDPPVPPEPVAYDLYVSASDIILVGRG
jgi:hypothetical protein